VEEPKPKPAKIRAVSYEAAIDQLFKRMRSSSSAREEDPHSSPFGGPHQRQRSRRGSGLVHFVSPIAKRRPER
jgi:hypothetical protein